MTKKELIKKAQEAFVAEYGFAPAACKVHLLEASDDGKYILCRVGMYEYRVNAVPWYDLEKTAVYHWDNVNGCMNRVPY